MADADHSKIIDDVTIERNTTLEMELSQYYVSLSSVTYVQIVS